MWNGRLTEEVVDVQHARQLCECPVDQQRLLYRYSLAELDDLLREEETAVDSKVGDLAAESEPTKRSLRRGAPSLSQSVSKKVWSVCFVLRCGDGMWLCVCVCVERFV